MAELSNYINRVKPAMDKFFNESNQANLKTLETTIDGMQPREITIFQLRILPPFIIKLDELKDGGDQELRVGMLNCVRKVVAQLYINEVKGLSSILVVALINICDCKIGQLRPNISEELKLAAVRCISEAFRRSTGDVREVFYSGQSTNLIGQILIILLQFIQTEKYKQLIIAAIECIMIAFYVHDAAEETDIVLRKQIADGLFICLPKVLTVLYKTSLSDDIIGERIKSTAIKAFGRVLCLMLEDYDKRQEDLCYDAKSFQSLLKQSAGNQDSEIEADKKFFSTKNSGSDKKAQTFHQLQDESRSQKWINATTQNLQFAFGKMNILCSDQSSVIRQEYARLCCSLVTRCTCNLKYIFVHLLEGIIALSEDADDNISKLCRKALQHLQHSERGDVHILDEHVEQILDAHLLKIARILHRCDESEQYAELLFLKGFLRNVNGDRLTTMLSVPKCLESFVRCLLATVELHSSQSLLNEEYSLRELTPTSTADASTREQCDWRRFKYICTPRCVALVEDICAQLGAIAPINCLIFDHCRELLEENLYASNEVLYLQMLLVTSNSSDAERATRLNLAGQIIEQLLDDKHWHLALHPDADYRLKPYRPTDIFVDSTPGLFESAVEVRKQDCDSDDDHVDDDVLRQRVTILDAQLNVLHTAIILDCLGSCAKFLGALYERHLLHSLHKVLLKLSHSNTIVYKSARYAFMSIQSALNFSDSATFIEHFSDHLSFHLNCLLKRSAESSAAADILTVVLQHSTRNSVAYLEGVFNTIQGECSKSQQAENLYSYLRLYNAFLLYVRRWQAETDKELEATTPAADAEEEEEDILQVWLNVLNEENSLEDFEAAGDVPESAVDADVCPEMANVPTQSDEEADKKPELPRHIKIVKDLLEQVLKFLNNSNQMQQVLALECIITGLPSLKDYEDELLPLVHLTWQPLVEKFRQKDAIVLHRCFDVLALMGEYAKDFILKRSLNDIIPFLNEFLKSSAAQSSKDHSLSHTQEYKLQCKLLASYGGFVENLQIDGKDFDDILNIVTLYLARTQPKELQALAVQFFVTMISYDPTFVYVVVDQKSQLPEYRENVAKVLSTFDANK